MNFKNNIERCKAAISMGYRVQMASGPHNDGKWGAPDKHWLFDAKDDAYRVYPADEQAFRLQLAAREALAAREPVLQDIDQYKKQMAHIRAATFGYWTEESSVHPDYDTVVLRNVARLYAKCDALHKKDTSAEDLLIQLKHKLGPRAAITVHMNPEM